MTMKPVHTANFSYFVSIKFLEDSCGTLAIMQAVWPDNVFRMETFNRSCCTCTFFSIPTWETIIFLKLLLFTCIRIQCFNLTHCCLIVVTIENPLVQSKEGEKEEKFNPVTPR